jgi:hypothetical protein
LARQHSAGICLKNFLISSQQTLETNQGLMTSAVRTYYRQVRKVQICWRMNWVKRQARMALHLPLIRQLEEHEVAGHDVGSPQTEHLGRPSKEPELHRRPSKDLDHAARRPSKLKAAAEQSRGASFVLSRCGHGVMPIIFLRDSLLAYLQSIRAVIVRNKQLGMLADRKARTNWLVLTSADRVKIVEDARKIRALNDAVEATYWATLERTFRAWRTAMEANTQSAQDVDERASTFHSLSAGQKVGRTPTRMRTQKGVSRQMTLHT